jgi:hypothetical protein
VRYGLGRLYLVVVDPSMSIEQIAAGEAFPADYTGEFPHIIICKYRSAAALFLIPETIGL